MSLQMCVYIFFEGIKLVLLFIVKFPSVIVLLFRDWMLKDENLKKMESEIKATAEVWSHILDILWWFFLLLGLPIYFYLR